MEETGYEIISGAPTTPAVKGIDDNDPGDSLCSVDKLCRTTRQWSLGSGSPEQRTKESHSTHSTLRHSSILVDHISSPVGASRTRSEDRLK